MLDGEKREIIIVRRRSEDDGNDHHGGVWKIAYADFMTAMMAFFLVMWLLNATDSHAKREIAHYFNPIKLIDATDDRKGISDVDNASSGSKSVTSSRESTELNDGKSMPDGKKFTGAPVTTDKPVPPVEQPTPASEAKLFQDPFAVLADLAKNATKEALHPDFAPDISGKTRVGQNGLTGGSEFRDPFDPVYWKAAGPKANPAPNGTGTQAIDQAATPDAALLHDFSDTDPSRPPATSPDMTVVAKTATSGATQDAPSDASGSKPATADGSGAKAAVNGAAGKADAIPQTGAQAASDGRMAKPAGSAVAEPKPGSATDQRAADAAAKEATTTKPTSQAAVEVQAQSLARQIGDVLARSGAERPALDVAVRKDGILISLMDNSKGAMFAVGSAEPRPDLVVEMARIGAILAKEKGQVIIGGHTDGRPFHNASYDNWRLSSARAQMAYYMLVRGGLPEGRVARVEGNADHQLKVASNPLADANRRIEILLRHEAAQ